MKFLITADILLFKEDVTMNKMYHNSNMSMLDVSHINTGNGE